MPPRSKKRRFLDEHPLCCFCGGSTPALTIDHVPPKACFPAGYQPDGFEFPSCSPCNNGTSRNDTIFGYYSMLLDWNEANETKENRERLRQLGEEMAKRYPEAAPDTTQLKPVHRAGEFYTSSPIAFVLNRKPAMNEAIQATGEKLAHALYYREAKRIVGPTHRFFASAYQIQDPLTQTITDYFKNLLPSLTVGMRPNIKKYGSRFAYMAGYKDQEDFFVFAAQFGFGLVLWGIVLGSATQFDLSAGSLREMLWKTGGSGLGSNKPVM